MGSSMTEFPSPSIVGLCSAPRESQRDTSSIFASISISLSGTYGAGTLNERTDTMTASASKTWSRVPFPSAITGDTPPGDGNFYMVQPNCCCPCRAEYVFDEQTLGLFTIAGAAELDFDIEITSEGLNNGVPFSDSSTLPSNLIFSLWNLSASPCRKADGPQSAIFAEVALPEAPLDSSGSDSSSVSVTGDHNPTVGSSFFRFNFTTPKPCSDEDYNMTIVKTWETTTGSPDDNGSTTSNITFEFTFS